MLVVSGEHWAGAQELFPDSRAFALPGQGHDVDSASWAACATVVIGKRFPPERHSCPFPGAVPR
jgi:hypothetical protein